MTNIVNELNELKDIISRPTYHEHNRDTYRLVAVSGDLSANGMSNTASIIEVPADLFDVANNYIAISTTYERLMRPLLQYMFDGEPMPADIEAAKDEICNLDKQALESMTGIFTSKFAVRSTWAWLETPDFDYDAYEAAEAEAV